MRRVALIDSDRVVAAGTPAELAQRATAAQRIQFRPSRPLDDALLTALPAVSSVVRRGDLVIVSGTADALNQVTSVLAAPDRRQTHAGPDFGHGAPGFLAEVP